MANGWVEVSECLPVGEANRVLCVCKRSPVIYLGHYEKSVGWRNLETERAFSSDVTHWRLLPPLPKVV